LVRPVEVTRDQQTPEALGALVKPMPRDGGRSSRRPGSERNEQPTKGFGGASLTTPRVIMEAVMAIVLVTGTSSGIGLATAVTVARGGHKVIATMRNVDRASELLTIVSAEGLPVTVAALDVDDDASVSDAFDKVLEENGRIDVLVNNAGVGARGSVDEVPMGVFRQVMETNFFGARGGVPRGVKMAATTVDRL
jgi:hypothetical protein